MNLENLTIIGTSHIAQESMDEVEKAILETKPDIVAVELDKTRVHSLFQKDREKIQLRAISQIGFKGFAFSVFGQWAEKKLGKLVGVEPGSEMKKAIQIARKEKIKIALIDQDIQITLRRFSKALTWREKGRFVKEVIMALFGKREAIHFDLTKVPSDKIIEKLLTEVKIKYPNVYKVLIEERNIVMAHNLQKLLSKYLDKKIVAVVGAGHKEDILDILSKSDSQYSYSFSYG